MELTAEYLRSILDYYADTGIFKSKIRRGTLDIGDIAGSITSNGYIDILINYKHYKAHRLAWLGMTGEWPKSQIDHINGIRTDNRFINLREATNGQNKLNTKIPKNNTSGAKGVVFRKDRNYFEAKIKINNQYKHLGTFKTLEEAAKAYNDAAREYAGEFAKS